MVNNRTALMRSMTACWHAANYDAAGNSGNGQYRNMGRTPAAAINALPLLNSATAGQRPTRLTQRGLWLPGSSGNYASVPDAAALDITGDIDIRVRAALTDWTPAANMSLIGKYTTSGNQRSYRLTVLTTGIIRFQFSTDGTTPDQRDSTVAPTVTNGDALWIRVTVDVDNGSSQSVTNFYTSSDGTSWTQLGSTVTSSVMSLFAGTAVMEIGSVAVGTADPLIGTVYRTQIYNGIAGTLVLDIDFTKPGNGQASFTADTGQTVTINRSATGLKSALLNGETSATLVFDGIDDLLTCADATLDNLLDGSYTAFVGVRQFGSPLSSGRYITKQTSTSGTAGFSLASNGTTVAPQATVSDGTNTGTDNGATFLAGAAAMLSAIRNVATDTIHANVDATISAGVTDPTTGTVASTLDLAVGARATALTFQCFSTQYQGIAIRALTATELKRLKAELQLFGVAA